MQTQELGTRNAVIQYVHGKQAAYSVRSWVSALLISSCVTSMLLPVLPNPTAHATARLFVGATVYASITYQPSSRALQTMKTCLSALLRFMEKCHAGARPEKVKSGSHWSRGLRDKDLALRISGKSAWKQAAGVLQRYVQ